MIDAMSAPQIEETPEYLAWVESHFRVMSLEEINEYLCEIAQDEVFFE